MPKRHGLLMTALLLAGGTPPVWAQARERDLRQEIEALKKGQQQIRRDLEEIKRLLQARSAPARAAGPNIAGKLIELGDNPVSGEATAPLTLVEFSDYQCPYCARHVRETRPQIEREYVETGKLRSVFVDLPLDIHKHAFKAALAARCAGEQGRYWQMHDRLFAGQQSIDQWETHAQAVGLDLAAFEACLGIAKHADEVRNDMALARELGVQATPSFVLGLTDPDDPTKVKGLSYIRGARSFEDFKAVIEQALAELED